MHTEPRARTALPWLFPCLSRLALAGSVTLGQQAIPAPLLAAPVDARLLAPVDAGTPVPRPPRTERVVSPEVAPDRRVTFRLRAPRAQRVTVERLFFLPKPAQLALSKDASGVWSATVGPVAPGLYEYNFTVDGMPLVDPGNPLIQPQLDLKASILEVPGSPALITEFKDVPHGSLHVHHYKAAALQGRMRRIHVYTPPGYEARAANKFPVLYLLHGSGDNDATWSVYGRAHFIIDNLLADKKIKPMIVVMTDGHPVPRGPVIPGVARPDNTKVYAEELAVDVMPLVEKVYRVRRDAGSRAIVGLSMGGRQALTVGLNHPDRFAWVGGMSSSIPPDDTIATALTDGKAIDKRLRWLWVGCGREDGAFARNQEFVAKLNDRGIRNIFRATPGGHNWPLWRAYLEEVLPQLFVARSPGARRDDLR